jgi:hypothetical protein
MTLRINRIIIFARNMKTMTAFYRDKLSLKALIDPQIPADEWIEFDAGGIRIALHKAHDSGGKGGCAHKLCFHARDVAKARAALAKKKVKLGPVKTFGALALCDGNDPEGNRFQLSNRA